MFSLPNASKANRFQLFLNGSWIDLHATTSTDAIAEANEYHPRAGDRIEEYHTSTIVHKYGKNNGHHHRGHAHNSHRRGRNVKNDKRAWIDG